MVRCCTLAARHGDVLLLRMGANWISKRQILDGATYGVAGAVAASLIGCDTSSVALQPSNKTHQMPAESDVHTRTFMQWPVSKAIYGGQGLRDVQATIMLIANAISAFEPVALLSADPSLGGQGTRLSGDVEIWDIQTDDLWCRDSGPNFVKDSAGNHAIAHIQFNGWGNKQACPNDALIAERIGKRLGIPLIPTGLAGEQGGLEHDGAGLIMAHESSWVNPNRNTISRDEIGARLCAALGGEKVLWSKGLKDQDITDYHIDALARFVGPGHVLIQIDDVEDRRDPWSRAAHDTLRMLTDATDATGKSLTITKLPEPTNIRATSNDFVSSYVNFYVCNGAVIAAQFGDRQGDGFARETLQDLYPNREIVMLNIDPLGGAGGGIHCATQQQIA